MIKYWTTSAGGSPHNIFARASRSAWARSTCPGTRRALTDVALAGDAVGVAEPPARDGAAVRKRSRLTRARVAGGCAGILRAINESAASVPSAPQVGHAT